MISFFLFILTVYLLFFLILFSSFLNIFLISFVELFKLEKNIKKIYPIKIANNITVKLLLKAKTKLFLDERYFSATLSSV